MPALRPVFRALALLLAVGALGFGCGSTSDLADGGQSEPGDAALVADADAAIIDADVVIDGAVELILPRLVALSISDIPSLSPAFDADVAPAAVVYAAEVPLATSEVAITATALDANASVFVNDVAVESGVASAPISLNLGVNTIVVKVVAIGGEEGIYTVELARGSSLLEQAAYIKASNTQNFDQFGFAVAVSGDFLAVGAIGEDGGGAGVSDGTGDTDNAVSGSGAVYLFRKGPTGWEQEAYIKASNTDELDSFGGSLALFGDTLAVSAVSEEGAAGGISIGPGDTENQRNSSGAVYVFRRGNLGWAQEAYVKASNPDRSDNFGFRLALSSDTLVVTTIRESGGGAGIDTGLGDTLNAAPQSGAAYVFRRNVTTWTQEAYIKASNPDEEDGFGGSVSLSGDTLVVGAIREDGGSTGVSNGPGDLANAATDSGAAYVFRRSGNLWSQEAYLKASNSEAGDFFGFSVMLEGDSLAVGATREDGAGVGVSTGNGDTANGLQHSGAVYIFERSGVTWAQSAYVKSSNPDAFDLFGSDLARSENALAVTAPFEAGAASGVDTGIGDVDNGATAAGAIYLFRENAGSWSQEAYIKASNTDASDQFGYSISMSNGILATGARTEAGNLTGVSTDGGDLANGSQGSGAVYVLE